MRILVCGGRDFSNWAEAFRALDASHAKRPITCIIHGDARGADRAGKAWAVMNEIEHVPFPAAWDRLGNSAGPIRNQQVIDEGKPDGAIAFPGGAGTADMVRRSLAAGLKVWRPFG